MRQGLGTFGPSPRTGSRASRQGALPGKRPGHGGPLRWTRGAPGASRTIPDPLVTGPCGSWIHTKSPTPPLPPRGSGLDNEKPSSSSFRDWSGNVYVARSQPTSPKEMIA